MLTGDGLVSKDRDRAMGILIKATVYIGKVVKCQLKIRALHPL